VTGASEAKAGFGTAVVATLATLVLLFPAYWMVITALQGDSAIFAYPPRFWPTDLNADALWSALKTANVGRWLANTTIVAGVSSLFVVPVAALTAYALSRFRGKVASFSALLIVVSQMMPPVLLLVPYFILFRELGLLDGLLGLILANFAWALPVSAWLMKAAFDGVPHDLEEAALIDGCTRFSAIWRIALPLALPGIAASAVFAFISAWDEYFFARTLIADSSKWVVAVGLGSFVGDYSVSWQQVMAVATISTLPPAILFMLVQRAFVSNLSAGAVKG